MRVTAVVLRDPMTGYSVEEIELPAPGPGQVLVRIESAGICHTDSLLRQMPIEALPMIPGHEGAGVVEQVGAGVRGIAEGDHVVLSYDYCGLCANCRTGHTSYCDEFTVRNFVGHPLDGSPGATDENGAPVGSRWFGQSSFATHAVASANNTVVVDRSADLTMLGPLGCGIQTGAGSVLNALAVRAGSSLAVFGAGAVGLAAVMAGVVAGAAKIVAVDLHQHRLDLALSLGATHVVDAGNGSDDVAAQVQAITGGGADFSFDTTGVPSVIAAAVGCLRMTGTCGLVGAGSQMIELEPSALFGKRLIGIFEGDAVPQLFIPKLVSLWQAGRFPFDRLVEKFDLSAAEDAERASLAGKVVKPVLISTHD